MKTLKEYRLKTNPFELHIVELFSRKFKYKYKSSLNDLFKDSSTYTERDEDLVISTIHWLATPVGTGFINSLIDIQKTFRILELFKKEFLEYNPMTLDVIVTGLKSGSTNLPNEYLSDKDIAIVYKTLEWVETSKFYKQVWEEYSTFKTRYYENNTRISR